MSDPFIGEIRVFGFNFTPRGWESCDGQVLQISEFQTLFSLLGTTYGGDGRTTFALPDLRGRAASHKGPARQLGSKAGSETVALSMTQMPQHTHQAYGDTSVATSNSPANNLLAQTAAPVYHAPDGTKAVAMAAASVATVGSGDGHNNMQPSLAVNFCIAVVGLFPSRN